MSRTLSQDVVEAVFSGTQIGDGFEVISVAVPVRERCMQEQQTSPKCFKEGTLVKTKNGDKKIEDIKVGEKVLSKNPETGEITYKTVTKLYRNETHAWVTIHLGKKYVITTTLLHVFFVSGAGRKNAYTLKQGSQLFDMNGNNRTVTSLEIKKTKHNEKTYNIEVEDFHTYFVSSLGIWVSTSV